VPGSNVMDCAKACGQDPKCRASNFFITGVDAQKCALHLEDGDLRVHTDENFDGVAIRVQEDTALNTSPPPSPPPPPSVANPELCPEKDKQRVFIGPEGYEVSCNSKLQSMTTEKAVPGLQNGSDCATKCTSDQNCEGITWNPDSKTCTLHTADPNAQFASSPSGYALKKTNSPGKLLEEAKKASLKAEEAEKLKALEVENEKWKSASTSTFCASGPAFPSSMDNADNPSRKLIQIKGETFILSCDTATLVTAAEIRTYTSPYQCAEACATDDGCLGVGWITNNPNCVYHRFFPGPDPRGTFTHAYLHNALFKKSDKGKITKCVKTKPMNPAARELAPC
jgi:PAN domain-containing protein